MYSPIDTAHTSIPDDAWTKVNTLAGKDRRFFMLVNESGSAFRVETSDTLPTLATEGFKLADGQVYQEAGVTRSSANVYVYQNSGGPLTTLSIKEGA